MAAVGSVFSVRPVPPSVFMLCCCVWPCSVSSSCIVLKSPLDNITKQVECKTLLQCTALSKPQGGVSEVLLTRLQSNEVISCCLFTQPLLRDGGGLKGAQLVASTWLPTVTAKPICAYIVGPTSARACTWFLHTSFFTHQRQLCLPIIHWWLHPNNWYFV